MAYVSTTYTAFARHQEDFERLKRFVSPKGDSLQGLVIGAGLNTDVMLQSIGISFMGFRPEDRFSWEPFELLAILRNLSPRSGVTVVDVSEEVCNRLSMQSSMPVHDFFGTPIEYIENFLTAFPYQSASPDAIQTLNEYLRNERYGNKVSVFAKVDTPLIDRIINDDFMKEQADLKEYDAITALVCVENMQPGFRFYGKIKEILKPNGVLLISNERGTINLKYLEMMGFHSISKRIVSDQDGLPIEKRVYRR